MLRRIGSLRRAFCSSGERLQAFELIGLPLFIQGLARAGLNAKIAVGTQIFTNGRVRT
jgi:hypothetical protein